MSWRSSDGTDDHPFIRECITYRTQQSCSTWCVAVYADGVALQTNTDTINAINDTVADESTDT
jgi:hypothetical protein